MRIGELLVQQGLITQETLESALRAQTQSGGRLVSVLVSLNHIDGDVGTRALARLKRVPAAVQKHFDAAEPSAIARIPRAIADRHSAVPLGWAGEEGSSLIVAMIEPSDLLAVEEIRGVAGANIVPGIALELRVRDALERWYGVPRETKRPPSIPPEASYSAAARAAAELTIDLPPAEPPASSRGSLPPFVARRITAPRLALDPLAAPTSTAQRRGFGPPLPREDPDEEPLTATGENRVARSVESARRVLSAKEAIEQIGREPEFEPRLDILLSYLRGELEAAVVFAVRNDIAFAWKAFGPGVRGATPPKIAVPLTQPSMLVLPYEARTTFFGTPSVDGSEINSRIWKGLGTAAPREALALPVVIDDKVVAIVYAQPRGGERIAPPVLVEVANVCAVLTKP
jgi:hypothetical protein